MPPVLLDTNVLVYAVAEGMPLHAEAARMVDRGLRDRGRYCIAPQNIIEFAAVVTRPRFVNPPLPPDKVERIAGILYRSRRLKKIYPRRGTVIRAIREGVTARTAGPRWYDLFLAATMRDAGIREIVTEDVADFAAFPFVRALRISDAARLASGT